MPQHLIALYCKSFRDDFDRLAQLVSSFQKHKIPGCPLLISVPEADLSLLRDTVNLGPDISVVTDESFVAEGSAFQYGWLQQQVCKLSVFRTDFAGAYFALDSDSYLIAPPSMNLFYTGEHKNIVYSNIFTKFYAGNSGLLNFLREEQLPSAYPVNSGSVSGFSERLKKLLLEEKTCSAKSPMDRGVYIQELFSGQPAAVQPAQILHADILASFELFLKKHELDFYKAIALSPWEYNWYAYYAATGHSGEVVGVVSPVLHFADDESVQYAKKMKITLELISQKFCAIQMAARHFETLSY